MSAPILRVGKIKSSGRSTPQSVGGHLSRSRPTPNADPSRTSSNRWLVGSAEAPLEDAIQHILETARIDPAKVRKDAVLANDVLLTVSPEWFRPNDPEKSGTWDEARLKIFTAEAQAFLTKTFGKRVIAAVLHLDEATPHIQAVVVPVMRKKEGKGWRLSGRDMFDPGRLASLQQDWEDCLRKHGVGPRTPGSRARHTTLREYYGVLEAFRPEDGRNSLEVGSPPSKALLEAPSAYQAKVREWREAEAQRLRDELHPLVVEASRGRLYDAERRSGSALRTEMAEQAQELNRVREALVDADQALARSKDEVARLRAAPINAVAAMLGHTGDIRQKENAIDLVKRVGSLDYNQAVTWLAQRFGPDAAASAVREEAEPRIREAALAAPVLTKGERVKTRLVAQQLDALAAPAYRVTVMQNLADGSRMARNIGKAKDDGPEKTFTRDEMLTLIPRLTSENIRGGNIFITPLDPAAHHVLIDDLKPEQLNLLRSRGYAPALVLETSPENHQAMLKVPTSAAPKEAVNTWFKDLNRDLGDQKIVGLVHPLRLAGFENRKPKHQNLDGHYPFVRLVEAANRMCARAIELVQTYATAQRQSEMAVATPRRR